MEQKLLKSNFYLITGGPGVGKSSVIKLLQMNSFTVVSEAARTIIKEQKQQGHNAIQVDNRFKFCQLMLQQCLHDFLEYSEFVSPVFFDRGLPDLLGYQSIASGAAWDNLIKDIVLVNKQYRYNQRVFIFPPWQEIYTTDEERVHTFEQAVLAYDIVKEALISANYDLIEVPKLSVEQRVTFILEKINIVI
ncbi:ATPase [Legionella qingyii]|uniref:ATPase n=1 Tax=Legionella qingyii TaxID=2184757 RepID=A0A317U4V7_9GAMM|nr:AAA family ATPase [Legionella qingyii]PWY56671.1 ATPase [Legionella qingyii]RUR23484.1 ATPase [Legionella qingyii]RUR26068.1 ATPase [Legionella qingyii]